MKDILVWGTAGNCRVISCIVAYRAWVMQLYGYRKNWEDPEYASRGKQGVANRDTS